MKAIKVKTLPEPVFVIGKNRSGTKWLSNIIARHNDIASVQGDEFGGILECNLFLTFPAAFGCLSYKENYCAMASAFSKTSFFQLTGLDESLLFNRQIADYCEFFRHVMDAYAEKSRKSRWLQKASPLALPMLYASFPDARFVLTSRNMVDNIRSSLGLRLLHKDARPTGLARASALYYLSEKTARLYEGKPNVIKVTYEDLRRDKRRTTESVCDSLELPFQESMLDDKYKKNTSFQKGVKKDDILSPRDVWKLQGLSLLFRFMPLWLLRWTSDRFGRHRDPRGSRFIALTYSMLRQQYKWDDEDRGTS